MKYRLCVACIYLFVFWATGTTPLHAQDRLVLGCLAGAEDTQYVISMRILTEAYGRIGIEIETRIFTGPRSLSMANRGSIDGELFRGDLDKDKFHNLIRIPVPILYGELVVFTKDVEFEVMGWESLKPYVIGIYSGLTGAETGTKGMRVEPVATVEQLFKKLAAGRNDIVVFPRDQGMDTLKSLMTLNPEGIDLQTLQKIRVLEPPIHLEVLYHTLHKKHAALVPKITAVLQEMTDEGLIQRITEEVEADFFSE